MQTTTMSAAPGLITSSGVPTITSSLSPLTIPGTTSYKLLPILSPMSIAPTMSTPFFFVSILPIPPPIAPSPQRITFTFFILTVSFSKQYLFKLNMPLYISKSCAICLSEYCIHTRTKKHASPQFFAAFRAVFCAKIQFPLCF